ncbi:DMT family transporter [Corynebacterium flavescens]|uniref:DMT family transporter n=1 Tax=Corynebacterium flavescens TaxID=28028 RepID=UPI003FD0C5D6
MSFQSGTKSKKAASVALLTVATVFAGMLGPMQSFVNGRLGTELQDGHAASVVSFSVGLILMLIIVLTQSKLRKAFFELPGHLINGTIPRWNFFAGLCGATIVLSEGISVGFLGVAVFQTALIAGMVISGIVCDRLGIGVPFKQALSAPRVTGALLAIVATILVVVPNWTAPHMIALAVLPFVGGLLAGWQPAGNSEVGKLSDSMLVSITWNFLVGFIALGGALLVRVLSGNAEMHLPGVWWMYLGGPLGLASIALMALLVRGLGLLLLGLASTAGQLIGSILVEIVLPTQGAALSMFTVIGAVVALVAAGIAMMPTKKIIDEHPELSEINV